jgi:diacylglycerol kinase family enzyme
LRRRLPAGVHLPHPRVVTTSGRAVEVHVDRGRLPLRIDGLARGDVADLTATVVPRALRLAL